MLGLVFKHQDFDIKSQKICKQKSGRVTLRFTPAPPTALRRAPPPILVRGWTSPPAPHTPSSRL